MAKTTSIASATQPPASRPRAVGSCSTPCSAATWVVATVSSAMGHCRLHCRARFVFRDLGARDLGDDLARGLYGDIADRRERGIACPGQPGIGLIRAYRKLGIRRR